MDFTTSDGVCLNVEVAGETERCTVVLVHGFAGSIDISWRSNGVIAALVAEGLRVVAFDLRGHGQSDRREDLDMTQARLVADLREVVERFGGGHPLVVGYSLGGSLALLACETGLDAPRIVVGGLPTAIVEWTANDAAQCRALARALRRDPEADDAMQGVVAFFELIDAYLPALASLMDDHRPTVSDWAAIRNPVTVIRGADDSDAIDPTNLVKRLPRGRGVSTPGDHITAPGSDEFLNTVTTEARLIEAPGAPCK